MITGLVLLIILVGCLVTYFKPEQRFANLAYAMMVFLFILIIIDAIVTYLPHFTGHQIVIP